VTVIPPSNELIRLNLFYDNFKKSKTLVISCLGDVLIFFIFLRKKVEKLKAASYLWCFMVIGFKGAGLLCRPAFFFSQSG